MTKTLIWRILSMALILLLSLTSCSLLNSNSPSTSPIISIPPTSYPIDIIGHVVTIANNVIAGGKTYGPGPNGSQYWIVQIAIKNKLSQTLIFGEISILSINNPTVFAGVGGPMFLPNAPPASQQGAQYTPGEISQFTLCFSTASRGLDPDQYQLCLYYNILGVGTETAYGQLVNTNKTIESYNWDLQETTELAASQSSEAQSTIAVPSGTYTGTIIGNIKQSVSFQSNNTLVVNNNVEGKTLYKYVINSDGTITETNIVTNQTGTESFKYIPEQNLVVLGGVSYFK